MPIYELMISIETKCKDEWELKEKLRKVLKKEKLKPKEVTITETGYTEDGRIDMATVEGYRIFRKECKDIGIILPRRPQYE